MLTPAPGHFREPGTSSGRGTGVCGSPGRNAPLIPTAGQFFHTTCLQDSELARAMLCALFLPATSCLHGLVMFGAFALQIQALRPGPACGLITALCGTPTVSFGNPIVALWGLLGVS